MYVDRLGATAVQGAPRIYVHHARVDLQAEGQVLGGIEVGDNTKRHLHQGIDQRRQLVLACAVGWVVVVVVGGGVWCGI